MRFYRLPGWLVDAIRQSPVDKVKSAFSTWSRLEERGELRESGHWVEDEEHAFFPLVEALRARRFDTMAWLLGTSHPNEVSREEVLSLLVAEDPEIWEEEGETWSRPRIRALMALLETLTPSSMASHPSAFVLGRFAARLPDPVDALSLLFARGLSPDAHDAHGDTNLLMVASTRGLSGQMGRILAAGANPDWKDPYGNTAFHELWEVLSHVAHNEVTGVYQTLFDQLLAAGASPGAVNMNGETPVDHHRRKMGTRTGGGLFLEQMETFWEKRHLEKSLAPASPPQGPRVRL
jgi:hypothetical protein